MEAEERLRSLEEQSREDSPDFLSSKLDKDDIMRRLGETLDEERYLKMFSLMYVVVAKAGEAKAVMFQCKSIESDIVVEYCCAIPAADADDYHLVLKSANLYRGVESMLLEENYRIGLHEYLAAHAVDESLATAVEHLAILLRPMAVEGIAKQLRDFALAGVRS